MSDTIFAVSSGAPPAAIAIIRVSGPDAAKVARVLAGGVPEPRMATLRRLRDERDEALDRALALWFPAPASATGEDVLELHVHGGRAVVAAVERAIGAVPGTRRAGPGEFTRRALMNGRIDLAEAKGLADLLEAETETQRRAALAASEGALAHELGDWLSRLSTVRAVIEAAIDYDEEGDLAHNESVGTMLADLHDDLRRRLSAATSERVREGWRVVIAGPPNAGKSSLFNAMLGRDAAIVAPVAGTTRDRIESRVKREGQLFTLIDTAGLAEWTDDAVEAEGIRRSQEVLAVADLVLWLSDDDPPHGIPTLLWLRGRCDLPGRDRSERFDLAVSAHRLATVDTLWRIIKERLDPRLNAEAAYLQEAQWRVLAMAAEDVSAALAASDVLLRAEHLRAAADRLTSLLRLDATEEMLDALFARFCMGK